MQSVQNLIDYSFIDSLGSIGIPYSELDFSNEIKCGRIWNTVNKYLRSSVLDLIDEKKINISIGEKVKQIELDNRGTVSLIKTEKKTYKADYFILSSGTLGSNELLLNHLKENSMLNKSIGKGVQDHTNLRVNVFTNKKTGSLNEIYYSSLKKTVWSKTSVWSTYLMGGLEQLQQFNWI